MGIHNLRLTAAILMICPILVGCGGGEPKPAHQPDARTAFPRFERLTYAMAFDRYPPADAVALPSQQVYEPGENRFGFGVFNIDHTTIPDATVAIYASKGNGYLRGPFPAEVSSLQTKGAFRSESTSNDPDAPTHLYVSDVTFPEEGRWNLLALIAEGQGGYSVAGIPGGAKVANNSAIPDIGEQAPTIDTPTVDDVGGDLTSIDTRVPPSSMHEVSVADVIGRKPVMLLFATPALCTSRVCAPVVDVAEEVKNELPEMAAYVHMEIYNDNDPNKGPRPQLLEYGLESEPWLFAINRNGKIVQRIEGAFDKKEFIAALQKANGSGGA